MNSRSAPAYYFTELPACSLRTRQSAQLRFCQFLFYKDFAPKRASGRGYGIALEFVVDAQQTLHDLADIRL